MPVACRGAQAVGVVSAAGGGLGLQFVRRLVSPWDVGCAGARARPGLQLLTDPRGACSCPGPRYLPFRGSTDALLVRLYYSVARVWSGYGGFWI